MLSGKEAGMAVKKNTVTHLVDEIFSLQRALRNASATPAGEGLPLAAVGVLHLLCSSGECRLNELAAIMGLSQSALSRQVSDLVEAGLISRRPDPLDGRAALLSVSPEGLTLLKETLSRRAARLRGLLGGWTEDEAQSALESVKKLTDAFNEPEAGERAPVTGRLPIQRVAAASSTRIGRGRPASSPINMSGRIA
jgi:DNA-binding MarR family transcriptional regulator